MSAPIGNNNNVNPIQTPITGASSSVTTGEIGDHSVSVTVPVDGQLGTTTVNTVVTGSLVDVPASTSSASGTVPITATVTTSVSEDSQLQKTSESTEKATDGIFRRAYGAEDVLPEGLSDDDILFNTENAGRPRETGATGEVKTESGKLPELAIPPYNSKDPASLLQLLRNSTVQSQMKQKCGHYIWPDPSKGSFVFIPNGDYSKIQSIKVCNAKTNQPLSNPKDVEKWICKFSFAYSGMRDDWENKRSSAIRQKVGLEETASVDYTTVILNGKYKMATAYGPFNAKEMTDSHTPSVWRRGTKVSVPKETWEDVGGWDPLGTIPDIPETIDFTNESMPTSGSSGPTPSGGFVIPPINVHVNLGGITTNVNTTGGTTAVSNTEPPRPTKASSDVDDSSDTESEFGEISLSYTDHAPETSNYAVDDTRVETTSPAPSQAEVTTVGSKIPSLSLPEENLFNPLTAPAHAVANSLSNVLSLASARTTPQQGPQANAGPDLLKKIRAHLDKVYTPEGTVKEAYRSHINNIAAIITHHEQGTDKTGMVSYNPLEHFDFGDNEADSTAGKRSMLTSINNVAGTLTTMLNDINLSIATSVPVARLPLPQIPTYTTTTEPLTTAATRINSITESNSRLNIRPWDTGEGGEADLATIESTRGAVGQVTQALEEMLKGLR